MHVLVTSDTITGVWTYTRELVSGLVASGHRVTLVSFGDIPLPSQISWMKDLRTFDYHPTAFRLEWMQDCKSDLDDSTAYLTSLVEEVQPDILHLSQFCYGSLAVDIPRIVVAHGDVITWWITVHGREPRESQWLRWYRDGVTRGLAGAHTVVAPSGWMLESLRASYDQPMRGCVIYNGRNPVLFNPFMTKDDSVIAVGRLWDAGKQVSLLTQNVHALPVCIVGSDQPGDLPQIPIRADVKLEVEQGSIAFKGPQTESQLRILYSRAAMYAATARYEPFGMPALEAAFSRCAIIANDIPSLREIWGDSAVYFRSNDAANLSEVIRSLGHNRDVCRAYGNRAYQRARERFTAKRMVEDYLRLYRTLVSVNSAAA
ncbi:MAG TPA: glycosyltransferase family 4 protein [Terriglobales bacterium]|nr:glycosyltransferase family 4 protein [Terriglobales bacterium]